MRLEKLQEKTVKRGCIIFAILCILLLSGVILFQKFTIYKNKNIIKENVESASGTEFAFFVDNEKVNNIPKKSIDYSLNTYKSKCYDPNTGNQISNVSWDNEKWKVILKGITNTKTKCDLYFDQIYIDGTLNRGDKSIGPIPDLGNGRLVPIRIDSSSGKPVVKKASIFEEWYNYGNGEWANAIILKNGKEDNYEPNAVIKEEDIESYFVWIPRYEYQLWNGETETSKFTGITENLGVIEDATKKEELNKAKEIKVRFVTNTDAVQTGTNKDEWLTHPAFTSFNSNGMWVGKFETSKNNDSTTNDSISPESVQIKPGVTSWRNIKVANAFYTSYRYQRDLDSHMMKNMEWGAVAYLTNSIYGRCDEDGTCSEVRINNNSSFITGSSAVKEPTCGITGTNIECNKYGTSSETTIVNLYSNPDSTESSTTGNYYGVFDMAGGAWEYVMGVMVDQNGKLVSGRNNNLNSNFVGTLTYPNDDSDTKKTEWTAEDKGLAWPDSKYYETYAYSTSSQYYERGHLGDGTKELGPFYSVQYKTGNGDETTARQVSGWNADAAFFVSYDRPWFLRGAVYYFGTDAGTSSYMHYYGNADDTISFRVVLTP